MSQMLRELRHAWGYYRVLLRAHRRGQEVGVALVFVSRQLMDGKDPEKVAQLCAESAHSAMLIGTRKRLGI